MKVLSITPWFPIEGKPNFGIFIYEHARALALKGVEVQMLALVIEKGDKSWELSIEDGTDELSGFQWRRVYVKSKYQKYIYNLPFIYNYLARKYFYKAFPSYQPDVIIGNIGYPGAVLANEMSTWYGRPYFISEQWTKVETFISTKFWGYKVFMAYSKARGVLAVSEFLQQRLLKIFPKQRIRPVPNVVDAEVFHYKPKEKDKLGVVKFISVMELNTTKQPLVMAEALKLVAEKTGKKFSWKLVGDGPQREVLLEATKNAPYEFELLSRRPKKEIASLMHEADFLLHATAYETFCVVIAEALCTGTPSIVSDLEVLHELVEEGSGFFAPNDAESWAIVIQKALEFPFNNEWIATSVKQKTSYDNVGNIIINMLKS